ncbi:AsmA family protein [Vibrio sp. AK197]
MKKAGFGLLWLLLLLAVVLSAGFGALYTPYATPLVNRLLQYAPITIHAQRIEYQYPAHFTLNQVQLEKSTIQVDQVQAWLSVPKWLDGEWQFDSILLDGLDLTTEQLSDIAQDARHIDTQQLAIKNLKLTAQNWQIHELSIQVQKPQWLSTQQTLPYGNLQISAGVWRIHDQTLSDILIDAEYRQQNSTIYGASFHWRDAMISGQAEQYSQGWSLVNATINQLQLADNQPLLDLLDLWSPYTHHLFHINSLDLLNSSFTLQDYRFNNADISLEDIDLNHSLYQQPKASISFNAESLDGEQWRFIEPSANIAFANQRIEIEDFDTEFEQGRLQLAATITPEELIFHHLNLSDVKILERSEHYAQHVRQWLKRFSYVKLDQLNVQRGQIIQTDLAPYWQLTGINASGSQLSLVEHHQLGLWSGQAELSANNLSYDQIYGSQGIVELSANQGRWQIDRLFVPLRQGYVDLVASGDLNAISQPWTLTATGDGLPLSLGQRYFSTPVELSGFAEFNATLRGLAGDDSMLAHSLSGDIAGSIREGQIQVPVTAETTPARSQFEFSTINLHADRGRMTVRSEASEGASLLGELDLVNQQSSTLALTIDGECGEFHANLATGTLKAVSKSCPSVLPVSAPSAKLPQSSAAEDHTSDAAIID